MREGATAARVPVVSVMLRVCLPMSPTIVRLCPSCRVAKVIKGRCGPCQRAYEQRRGSASARGYDHRWQRIRRLVIARDPLCTLCLAKGRVTPSTEADHIIAKRHGGSDDLDNLRGTCKSCNA